LGPIGDGLIQVCRACHEKAIATVLTKPDPNIAPTQLRMAAGGTIVSQ
jgi:hypothetical protein